MTILSSRLDSLVVYGVISRIDLFVHYFYIIDITNFRYECTSSNSNLSIRCFMIFFLYLSYCGVEMAIFVCFDKKFLYLQFIKKNSSSELFTNLFSSLIQTSNMFHNSLFLWNYVTNTHHTLYWLINNIDNYNYIYQSYRYIIRRYKNKINYYNKNVIKKQNDKQVLSMICHKTQVLLK